MRGMLSRGYSVLAAALANSSSMAIPHAGHGVRWAGRRSVRRESTAHLRCPCRPDQWEVSDAFDELASDVCPALDATGDRPQKPPDRRTLSLFLRGEVSPGCARVIRTDRVL